MLASRNLSVGTQRKIVLQIYVSVNMEKKGGHDSSPWNRNTHLLSRFYSKHVGDFKTFAAHLKSLELTGIFMLDCHGQHGMKDLSNTSAHEQWLELNPRPLDLKSINFGLSSF